MPIDIRLIQTVPEIQQSMDVQRAYWGKDAENLVSAHMLWSIINYGGHVLGAWDGERLVGLLIGMLGTHKIRHLNDRELAMTNLLIYSKRLIVLQNYRGRNIGYHLKLEQRKIAMRKGIHMITWTFDPVLAKNAYLNIHKLGVIADAYIPDYFGDGLVGRNLSGDRLSVEWWVSKRRVEERVHGNRSPLTLEHYLQADTPIANPVVFNEQALPIPQAMTSSPTTSFALVEIPRDFPAIEVQDDSLANTWRSHLREVMVDLLNYGYLATDFLQANHEGHDRVFYLLSLDKPDSPELN